MNEKSTMDMSVDMRGLARRRFMQLVLSQVPAAALLAGCAAESQGDSVDSDEPAYSGARDTLVDCPGDTQQMRSRWLQLHAAYVGFENLRDLPGIASSFGADASLSINDRTFESARAIADAHAMLGMSQDGAGLSGVQVIPDREYFTDDELFIHGRIAGMHTGKILQFYPTLRQVEMHYCAFFRFDDAGKLVSERVVMNWAPLAGM